MKQSRTEVEGRFVVATPARSVCDDNARALERYNLLRFIALGTRRGTDGIQLERTRLNPQIGLLTFLAAKILSASLAESFRFRLHPWFDDWVKKQLRPGDHIISSYGYTNECFKWVRANGGKTFLDGGNSHPENFWTILIEEHRRWNCHYPPIARHQYERSLKMLKHTDFVLSPSSFVSESFLKRGFTREQIIENIYPVDLSCFTPMDEMRPPSRPLTLISTGSLSLRKGTPYLLEAFRLIRKKNHSARFLLTDAAQDSVKIVLKKYSDLPIEWSPPLTHPQLAKRLRSADIFILPSLEDGFARTVTEALACGLPVITTPNTGASDLVRPGINGEIVPIRDPQAIAGAVLKWSDKILSPDWSPRVLVDAEKLSFEHFEREFIQQLQNLNLT